MTEAIAARAKRREQLRAALEPERERRLTVFELRLLLEEAEDTIANHPGHDAALHEGPGKGADVDLSFCPHCAAQTQIQRTRALLESGQIA